jgi:uncharacterized protein YcfL
MKKRCCLGLILFACLLTGCGSHFAAGMASGRQTPLGPSDHDGILLYLNDTSEVRFSLRGFRMGLASHTKAPISVDPQASPKPWLSYHLHF